MQTDKLIKFDLLLTPNRYLYIEIKEKYTFFNYRNRWEDIPFKTLLMLIKLFTKCIYIVPEGKCYKMIFPFRPTR